MRRFAVVMSWLAGCGVAAMLASGVGCSSAQATASGSDASVAAEASADAESDASEDVAVVPRGSRTLGVGFGIDDLELQNNARLVHDAGARTTNLTLAWDEIEHTDPDAGDASPPTYLFAANLHVANLVLPDEGLAATVTVDALDFGGSRAPVDLATRSIDDVDVASRYDRVTDYVVDQLPDTTITALFVASDVHAPLGDDPTKHAAFASFVKHAAEHVHGVKPNVKVGFVVSAEGAVAEKDRLAAAWAASDVIGIAYLPVDAAAQARSTSEVAADLDALLAALPQGKPVVVREAGYPSSSQCGSDAAKQAGFVRAMFAAWDRHASRISVLTFRGLDDTGAADAEAIGQRMGRSDAPFLAFLESLGLRSVTAPKASLAALIEQARARGF